MIYTFSILQLQIYTFSITTLQTYHLQLFAYKHIRQRISDNTYHLQLSTQLCASPSPYNCPTNRCHQPEQQPPTCHWLFQRICHHPHITLFNFTLTTAVQLHSHPSSNLLPPAIHTTQFINITKPSSSFTCYCPHSSFLYIYSYNSSYHFLHNLRPQHHLNKPLLPDSLPQTLLSHNTYISADYHHSNTTTCIQTIDNCCTRTTPAFPIATKLTCLPLPLLLNKQLPIAVSLPCRNSILSTWMQNIAYSFGLFMYLNLQNWFFTYNKNEEWKKPVNIYSPLATRCQDLLILATFLIKLLSTKSSQPVMNWITN